MKFGFDPYSNNRNANSVEVGDKCKKEKKNEHTVTIRELVLHGQTSLVNQKPFLGMKGLLMMISCYSFAGRGNCVQTLSFGRSIGNVFSRLYRRKSIHL